MRKPPLLPLLLLSLAGCTWDHANVSLCTADDSITFSGDVLPIFAVHCAIAGCHSAITEAGNLNLDPSAAYTELMRPGSGYVETLDPEGSVLYSSITSISSPMPPTGLLDTCTTNKIRDWMTLGAQNN